MSLDNIVNHVSCLYLNILKSYILCKNFIISHMVHANNSLTIPHALCMKSQNALVRVFRIAIFNVTTWTGFCETFYKFVVKQYLSKCTTYVITYKGVFLKAGFVFYLFLRTQKSLEALRNRICGCYDLEIKPNGRCSIWD